MIGKNLLHYRILSQLGVGGQGAVYKAEDTKLGRTVVIKVLPAELTAKPTNLKRFEREARLASSLDHPNICTIFDLNEVEGMHFIVMQHIAGRNVRQLVNGKAMELKSALSIALQVAEALTVAHGRGIIHRDIKAHNVMVTDEGRVKILDFGLAKLQDEEAAATMHQTELTEIGVPYGTATYAAPEQSRGERVDHRADIFSTGVLLYELLTGTWPFHGKTAIDVRHAVLYDAPAPVAERRREPVPPSVQQIVDRSLAKNAAERYQKMADMRDEIRAALQEIAGGAGDFAATAAPRHLGGESRMGRAIGWLRKVAGQRTGDASSSPSQHTSTQQTHSDVHLTPTVTSVGEGAKRSLAILPFRNLSKDPASDFYEFSLADAVITELARLKSLVVRPSSVIAKYQGQNTDPRDAGRELNVNAVLSAGFIHAGERFRVTAQLLDVLSGDMLWSDRIDAASADIFTVQDTIAQRIVDGLRLELTPDEQDGIGRSNTSNAAAYEEYLRGRDLFSRFIFRSNSPADCDGAIAHFQRAIELDENFALAYDGIGACHVNRVLKGFGGASDYEQADAAFERALSLDPNITEARMLRVYVYLWRGEKQKARLEVAQARRNSPNEAVVWFVKGTLHRLDGEYERALRAFDRLERLDPAAHVVCKYSRSMIYTFQGKFDAALRELDQADLTDSHNPLIKAFRSFTLLNMDDVDGAAALICEVLDSFPNLNAARPLYAICLAAQGRLAEANAQLTPDVEAGAEIQFDFASRLAAAYAVTGQTDKAFHWLERAIALGNENRPWLEKDRCWDGLRDDPRFKEALGKLTAP
jgi:serine/threonine-protein kinase